MRILEASDVNYNVEDIINAIQEELGFDFTYDEVADVASCSIGSSKLIIDFSNEDGLIEFYLALGSKYIGSEDFDTVSSILESSQSVLEILERMTKEGSNY